MINPKSVKGRTLSFLNGSPDTARYTNTTIAERIKGKVNAVSWATKQLADKGLIKRRFDDEGKIVYSPALSPEDAMQRELTMQDAASNEHEAASEAQDSTNDRLREVVLLYLRSKRPEDLFRLLSEV